MENRRTQYVSQFIQWFFINDFVHILDCSVNTSCNNIFHEIFQIINNIFKMTIFQSIDG